MPNPNFPISSSVAAGYFVVVSPLFSSLLQSFLRLRSRQLLRFRNMNRSPNLNLNPKKSRQLLDRFLLGPHVDFELKLLGADLMSIPGLYRFVQGIGR